MKFVTRNFFIALVIVTLAISSRFAAAAEPHRISDREQALFDTLATAKTEQEGRLAEDALWRYWFDESPGHEARALLDAAIERREAYDFEAAENHLNDLVAKAPDYAEAYNQRAFIRFLRQNYTQSKQDLITTLSMKPMHFGALAGLYQIYSFTAETEKAFESLQQAVTIHPWLKERGGLPKPMWPESYKSIHEPGQDI